MHTPYYPKPTPNKISSVMTLFKKNKSWLDGLYEKSYTMKMGHVRLPGADLYIPNEPDLIHRVLVSEVWDFPKNPLLHDVLSPLLGESIFTTNGAVWKKQRELLNPSFEMVRVQRVFGLMREAADDMMERLGRLADGSYHDLDEEMTFTTADIIFRTILSSKLSEKQGKEVLRAFVTFQEMSARIGMQKLFLLPSIFRIKAEREYKKAGRIIRDTLAAIIKPRYEHKDPAKKDILASLLEVKDPDTGEPFTFKEILDQVAMLFLAGHETTASSMTWTLYLLALYPEHQQRAYEEVMRIRPEGEFRIEDIQAMETVQNIFKESLRLYPPVSFMARVAAKDKVMRDKQIKKGSYVIVSPWLMHRNARYWEDPHMFDPDRFKSGKITKNTYFPFGLGPRICIGAGFAKQESTLLLASILRRYRLELQPGFVPDIKGRLTTRSINGMWIKLIPR